MNDSTDSNAPQDLSDRYAELLQCAVLAKDPLASEAALAEAADLGRRLVAHEVPLEEVGELHHEALIRLASAHPDLPLSQIAGLITAPLMEAYMAYSLALREQLERRAEAIVNARLEQSRRLEAIGTLAAGIAHDFNNILGAILGFSELLSDELPPASAGQQHLEFIQQASFRARDLIARMLTFAREMADDPTEIELVALIRETLDLVRVSLPHDVQLDFEPLVSEAWVLAEPSQIQQIVMNLCINAGAAISSTPGRIQVGVRLHTPAGLAPLVRLTVEDDGEGMNQEVQERVFDPFFTTKEPGKGSGLGLSVVHGLVGKLRGSISVSSEPGSGTRFTIDLPRLQQEGKASEDAPPIRHTPPSQQETPE
ncbi:histidine kinase [Thiorhodococcus drewsii AZ1]|uniref:histidine kinase n=1 Tax=Thiorhodococcus drewsii AZ1 TaxID=765913 RepID=G2E0H3_9GAMM|nr:ATP-binding protein [Thiorhodococcus drewsii]EGV31901.1 histidine kinase [Thiorhodococcus drewsii AZ1]